MSSDTSHLEKIILDLQKSMDARFGQIEDQLGDFRDEFHAESRATRTLLNQAFEPISDQLVHDG